MFMNLLSKLLLHLSLYLALDLFLIVQISEELLIFWKFLHFLNTLFLHFFKQLSYYQTEIEEMEKKSVKEMKKLSKNWNFFTDLYDQEEVQREVERKVQQRRFINI